MTGHQLCCPSCPQPTGQLLTCSLHGVRTPPPGPQSSRRSGACTPGFVNGTCWEAPAAFKRVYLIDFEQADAEGFVKKVAYIDLMDIQVGATGRYMD